MSVLLCLAPHVGAKRAELHARVIARVATDEDEAAILLVTGLRESGWRTGCVQGIGGAGTYGLGYGYRRWACAPLKNQAEMSLQAYHDKGAPWNWTGAIVHYLGARTLREPEAALRVELFGRAREQIACKCCL